MKNHRGFRQMVAWKVVTGLDKNYYDYVRGLDEAEAQQKARKLAREEGIFSGTSTGLNVDGALHLAQELGPRQTVATVAVDTGLKYLAGDLYKVQ